MSDGCTAPLLDSIYTSAMTPDHWPTTLELMAGTFRATFADRFFRTHDRSAFQGVAWGLDPLDYQRGFLDTWVRRNIWGSKHPVRVAGEVVSTRQMVPKDELVGTEIYNEYLAPRGLHEGLRVSLWVGAAGVEYLSMLRPWSAGAFGAQEVALARAMLPHLQRAVVVSRRLHEAEALAAAGLSALDRLHHAVVLLTASGRSLHVNPAGQRLLETADGLGHGPDGLIASTQQHTGQLARLLQRAGGAGGRAVAGALRLPRPSGRTPLALVAMPVTSAVAWDGGTRPAVMLCITAPDAPIPVEERHLTTLFGLTAAEAALAADLLNGLDVAEVATLRGRSVNTVRTHLQRLMAKTDTTRQSDLVRVLLSIPLPAADE